MSSNTHEQHLAALLQITQEHETAQLARQAEKYRPLLVREFGETITDRVVTDDGLAEFCERWSDVVESDAAIYAACMYLRDRPHATPAQAFATLEFEPDDDGNDEA